jgi:hypothetical protein
VVFPLVVDERLALREAEIQPLDLGLLCMADVKRLYDAINVRGVWVLG